MGRCIANHCNCSSDRIGSEKPCRLYTLKPRSKHLALALLVRRGIHDVTSESFLKEFARRDSKICKHHYPPEAFVVVNKYERPQDEHMIPLTRMQESARSELQTIAAKHAATQHNLEEVRRLLDNALDRERALQHELQLTVENLTHRENHIKTTGWVSSSNTNSRWHVVRTHTRFMIVVAT